MRREVGEVKRSRQSLKEILEKFRLTAQCEEEDANERLMKKRRCANEADNPFFLHTLTRSQYRKLIANFFSINPHTIKN